MDFISSISFQNKPLSSWTFLGHFCHHFWVDATAKQQQTHPKVMTEWKKWATDQSCIHKEVTSYKIHALVEYLLNFFAFFFQEKHLHGMGNRIQFPAPKSSPNFKSGSLDFLTWLYYFEGPHIIREVSDSLLKNII